MTDVPRCLGLAKPLSTAWHLSIVVLGKLRRRLLWSLLWKPHAGSQQAGGMTMKKAEHNHSS